MELFGGHFVYFRQVLLLSGLKMFANLVTTDRYYKCKKPHHDYFQNTYSKIKTKIRLWMYVELFNTHFVYLDRLLLASNHLQYWKTEGIFLFPQWPRLFLLS